MSNTLMKVTTGDLMSLRESVDIAISFYVRSCGQIALLADYFTETESEIFADILNKGLAEMMKTMDILREMDMKKGGEL